MKISLLLLGIVMMICWVQSIMLVRSDEFPSMVVMAIGVLTTLAFIILTFKCSSVGEQFQKDPMRKLTIPGETGVSKEQLGNATWTLLHTYAASYPTNPTRLNKENAKSIIDWIMKAYPCGECVRHFRKMMAEYPPDAFLESRETFAKWLCDRHNDVNRRIGKPLYNCQKAIQGWKFNGDCNCKLSEN